MASIANPQRAWYVRNNHIGIIENNGTPLTVDGITSDYTSISAGKTLRVYAISLDTDISPTLAAGYTGIPNQFHEGILFKAIAYGYMDPRNLNMQMASSFSQLYQESVKRAKKYARSQRITTGSIKSQEF
tara:strand:+ start:586 stop:975 length:390 start_codon:yes stop_codon:yes gene_type:complete